MENSAAYFDDISLVIQLALAPAFLLTGIAGILNVMTGRLARIIDRGRYLVEHPLNRDSEMLQSYRKEQNNLERRRYLASVAITACTLSALLICLVIVVLFLKAMLGIEIKWLIGSVFTASMLSLVVGLAFFLREVQLATRTVRIVLPDNQ